jgi:glycosyltransferase involved in cell wall biosynthesis
VFPKQSIKVNIEALSPLKLFWFSQSIGFERGLEDVIEAIGLLKNQKIELHLLGSFTAALKSAFEKFADEKGADKNVTIFLSAYCGIRDFRFCCSV